jgi:hypothetical protein
MTFSGKLTDAIALADRGFVLAIADVTGEPKAGDLFLCRFADGRASTGKVLDPGPHGGSGKAVADRSCLTGRPVAPYANILVDWPSDTTVTKDDLPAIVESKDT